MKEQVAKWLTAVMPGRAWSVVLSLAALTTMGLAFLWRCPDAGFLSEQLGAYWLLRRQVLWMSIGLSCFFLAVMVGWRRWLKAAPFLAVGWLAMYVVACCSPQVRHHLFVRIGCLNVDVMAWCSLVVALLLAWIAEKLAVQRVMRFLLVAGVVFSVVFAVLVLGEHERMAHVAAHFGYEVGRDAVSADEVMLRQKAQVASGEAMREAHWFSGSGEVLRRESLPGRFTYSMPFAAALAHARETCGALITGSNRTGVFPELGTASDVAFFVGPEGGFTDAETDAMFAAGAAPLRIGDWTLRVETAAVAGLGVLNVLMNRT